MVARALTVKIGDVFGSKTITGPAVRKQIGYSKKWILPWECTCGGTGFDPVENLLMHRKTCGWCYAGNVSHGGTGTPEHQVWMDMWARCSRPSHKSYENYGGRGITVCKEWTDFSVFIADMGKRPAGKLTIDRIDNEAGYSRDNCRWATYKENLNHRRITVHALFRGKSVPVSTVAEILGLPWQTVYRAAKKGRPVEETLQKVLSSE